MILKVKRTHPDAKLPAYSREGDGAMDLTCVTINETEQYLEYDTHLAIQLPKDHVGLLLPRSSISNQDLTLCNSVGLVDENFSGTIKARFKRTKQFGSRYLKGDRIIQLLVIPRPHITVIEVDELDETNRGNGAFGSSGN